MFCLLTITSYLSLQAINQQRLNEKEGKNQELRKRLFNIKNQKARIKNLNLLKKPKKKIRKRMMKKRSKQRYFIEVDSLEDCCVMII